MYMYAIEHMCDVYIQLTEWEGNYMPILCKRLIWRATVYILKINFLKSTVFLNQGVHWLDTLKIKELSQIGIFIVNM